MAIVEPLHIDCRLSEGGLRILLHVLDVLDEVLDGYNRGVNTREGTDLRVEPIIGIERSGANGLVESVIEREFDEGEPVDPIVLVPGDYRTKDLFDRLIGTLGLPVCLWMISGGQGGLDAEVTVEVLGVTRRELRTTICDDLVLGTMQLPALVEVKEVGSFRVEGCVGCCEVNHFGTFIRDGPDGVVSFAER